MRKYLAVVSGQPEYAKRFCQAIQRKEKLHLTAVPFETAAALESFAREHAVRLVLADEELVKNGELSVLPGSPGIVALSEKEEPQADENCLYRYQSMEEMLRQLSGLCQDVLLTDPVTNEGNMVRLTGVYSPANPMLRSAFAMTIAAAGKRDHRTLFMNMEEFSGIRQIMHYDGPCSVTDVFYALKKDQLDGRILRDNVVSTPNLDYLPPMQYADDVKEIGAEEWVKLIRKIAEVGGYEELVIDMPAALSVSADVMDQCAMVYLPCTSSGLEQARFQELEAYLKMPQHKKTAEKMKRIMLPDEPPAVNTAEEDYCEGLLYGNFGITVMREASYDGI